MRVAVLAFTITTVMLSYLLLHLAPLSTYGWFQGLGGFVGQSKDVVDVGYASYSGTRTYAHTVAYLGIPYAEPPLGDLRFRAPLPLNTSRVHAEASGRVMEARTYPVPCVQGTSTEGDAGGAGTEDCLKVNIYAPVGANSRAKLPVLVYIHGGAYIYGNPSAWPFDHWVEQSPNVVIVSIYYRLDAFGFLSLPFFASKLSPFAPGTHNAGFLDQREALQWIQRHITAFGGDPQRVTIAGHSAGGASVVLHTVARGANEKLFHQAISQSPYRTPVPTPEQQKPLFDHFANAAGCGLPAEEEALACLRKASISAIARAQDQAFDFFGYNAFRPVLDGHDIVERPTTSFLHGRFKSVPLLTGTTSNESFWQPGSDYRAFMLSFFPKLRIQDLDLLDEVYHRSDFTSDDQRAAVIMGESVNICSNSIMSRSWAQNRQKKVYAYRYDEPNPTSRSPFVAHSAENWMMFRGTNLGFNGTTTFTTQTDAERAFAAQLIAYWLSFVRSGDPNTYRLPHALNWEPYALHGAELRRRMVLRKGEASVLEDEPSPERERCKVVASLSEREQN